MSEKQDAHIWEAINGKLKNRTMTKFSKIIEIECSKEEVETVFTHEHDLCGNLHENKELAKPKRWNNVKLLHTKHGDLDQFLAWDNGKEYFLMMGKAGTEFDNL